MDLLIKTTIGNQVIATSQLRVIMYNKRRSSYVSHSHDTLYFLFFLFFLNYYSLHMYNFGFTAKLNLIYSFLCLNRYLYLFRIIKR